MLAFNRESDIQGHFDHPFSLSSNPLPHSSEGKENDDNQIALLHKLIQ